MNAALRSGFNFRIASLQLLCMLLLGAPSSAVMITIDASGITPPVTIPGEAVIPGGASQLIDVTAFGGSNKCPLAGSSVILEVISEADKCPSVFENPLIIVSESHNCP